MAIIPQCSPSFYHQSQQFFPVLYRLSDGIIPMWEENIGDREGAAGEFHVLEKLKGLFPVRISLSLLQASVHKTFLFKNTGNVLLLFDVFLQMIITVFIILTNSVGLTVATQENER